jgi:acyl carrier protein
MTHIHDIIRDHFGLSETDQLNGKTRFEQDLTADSLDRIELAMKLEDHLKITVDDEKMYDIKTIGDLDKWLLELKELA